uniref:AlNc14C33G3021 protein n=1 Tax=Albugo laibachii Nc14 TaxID=890382 RepID=F0W844_9STRA|nr:AlNc14C33G3021 [Albugo laibachii Nc14]|eukprot:CCA17327.1 AlNc14C33G3021 [Albugo laibachii Nc14]
MDFKSLRKEIIERLEEENKKYIQEYMYTFTICMCISTLQMNYDYLCRQLVSNSEQIVHALHEKLQSNNVDENSLKQIGSLRVENEQLLKERGSLKAMIHSLEKKIVEKEKELDASEAALKETQRSLKIMQTKADQDAQSLQSYRNSVHLLENELIQFMAPIK